MKSYVVKQLFKARWLAAIFAVALASPAMSQSSYCSDGSASCPDHSSSNNGNSAPSSNGAAPNQSGAYCPDGSTSCTSQPSGNNGNSAPSSNGNASNPSGAYCADGSASCPSRSGNNGNSSNASVNSNSGNTYRSDGSAGNVNGSGNNGRAPSKNGGAWVNPTNATTYNPDGSAGNANGRSNCGDNGCSVAGDAQRQSQANELPAPQPSNNGTFPNLPSPVQGGGQSDTLGTVPAPSNPVPQPVDRPATPSQPAVEVASRPAVTQVGNPSSSTQPTVRNVNVPNIPIGLYPTNPGELAQPIPLGWSAISGATRYRVTVKNQTTGGFSVDDIYVINNGYTVHNLPAGTSFTWDVAACNAAGCSERSANGSFRTGGSPSASVTSDSQCGQITRYQQAVIDGYYGLEQQRGTTKPKQAVLCRWQQLGTLDANLTDFQRSITAAANSGPNLPPAERRRIAREAVRNSPLVQQAISDLYYKIGEDYATKGVRSQLPSEVNFLASTLRFVSGGFDQIEQNRNESYVIRNVSNINYMASYMVNQISGYYTKKLGIDIPVSKLINLSGTAIGVYADAYVSGQK